MPGPKPNEENIAVVLRKLERLTLSEKLKWSPDERVLRARENVVGHVYTADFADRRIAIFEFQYAHYHDEDDWSWIPAVRMEVIDTEGRLLYEFKVDEAMSSARELLDAVRRQSSGVDQLFDKILSMKDE